MTQPTKEQVKELWERCGGVLVGANYNDGCPAHFVMLDGKWIMPPETIDLNNLFKYAVHGKLMKDGDQGVQERLEDWIANFTGDYDKDTLALFWGCYPIITGKEVIHDTG